LVQLFARAAQAVLQLGRPDEIAVQRVVDVDSDAAVQVLARIGGELAALRGPVLRDLDGVVDGGALALVRQEESCFEGRQANGFHVDEGIAGALVEGLEAADGAVELNPLPAVLGGHFQRTLSHAELDRAQADGRAVCEPAQAGCVRAGRAEGFGERSIQAQVGVGLPVAGRLFFESDTVGPGVDEEEPGLVAEPSRDHDSIGQLPAGNERLLARQSEGLTVPCGFGRDVLEACRVEFDEGGTQDGLSRGHPGEPLLLLILASESGDRQRAEDAGREDRHRGDGASDFLQHQAQVEVAEITSAVGGGNRKAQQVGTSQFLPQRFIEDGLLGLDILQAFVRREVAQDLSGQLAQRVLFVGEREVHARQPVL